MILSLRKLVKGIKYLCWFILLTYLLYQMLALLTNWIEPANRYREPSGRAVKVFYDDMKVYGDHPTVKDRLRFFYWFGE